MENCNFFLLSMQLNLIYNLKVVIYSFNFFCSTLVKIKYEEPNLVLHYKVIKKKKKMNNVTNSSRKKLNEINFFF